MPSDETAIERSHPGFAEGDRVFHDRFGAGTVIGGSPSLTSYTVDFDRGSRWVVFPHELAPLAVAESAGV